MSKQALATFRLSDGEYSFVFPAEDWADAERKLRAIRTTATLTGFPTYSYRANALTLPLVHLWAAGSAFVRNLLCRARD